MKPFTFLTPKTMDEAISLHESHGKSAKYIAGGTDVIVKIKEGGFESFEGTIEAIDEASGKITVLVEIFGRSTHVELEHSQVERI